MNKETRLIKQRENYKRLRKAGFTSRDSNRWKYRKQADIEWLIEMQGEWIKQRDEYLAANRSSRGRR